MLPSMPHAADRPHLSVRVDAFPLEKTSLNVGNGRDRAEVVTVEIQEGSIRGRGEAAPYPLYGETIEEIVETVERLAPDVAGGLSRRQLQRMLPPGAARNALDCAIWDFDSKRAGSSVWQMAGLEVPHRLVTAYTIGVDTPDRMAARAGQEAHRPILRLELNGSQDGGRLDIERVAAVRRTVPNAKLILDPHGSWTIEFLSRAMQVLASLHVEMIEQPLPAGADHELGGFKHTIPISADESCHDHSTLDTLTNRYDAVTVKLDKTGGLTEALALVEGARDRGMRVAVGGGMASSLGIAPAVLLSQAADWVALDAPLHLSRDRQPGLRYDGSFLYPANVSLWG
ncbi:MAG TPA: dipeptide epimerase [Stellaceae bacterium]|nr:dipeptide epimerase [Stellaceae bacterium]